MGAVPIAAADTELRRTSGPDRPAELERTLSGPPELVRGKEGDGEREERERGRGQRWEE